MDERCTSCGGGLTEGLDWCPRCLRRRTPVRRPRPDARPAGIRVPEDGTALRATETTLSLPAKLVLTAACGALLAGSAWLALRFVDVAGRAGVAFVVFWVASFGALVLLLLSSAWRPGRRNQRALPPPVVVRPRVEVKRTVIDLSVPREVVRVPDSEVLSPVRAARPPAGGPARPEGLRP